MPGGAAAAVKQRGSGDLLADKAPQCRPVFWGGFGDDGTENIGQDFNNFGETDFVQQVLDCNDALQEHLGLFAVWHVRGDYLDNVSTPVDMTCS